MVSDCLLKEKKKKRKKFGVYFIDTLESKLDRERFTTPSKQSKQSQMRALSLSLSCSSSITSLRLKPTTSQLTVGRDNSTRTSILFFYKPQAFQYNALLPFSPLSPSIFLILVAFLAMASNTMAGLFTGSHSRDEDELHVLRATEEVLL